MEKDSGHKLTELKVDGGMSNSELCMQTQADLVRIPIVRPKMRETTALGAAIAAGFAADVWKSFDELKEINTAGETTFEAKLDEKDAKRMLKKWEKVSCSLRVLTNVSNTNPLVLGCCYVQRMARRGRSRSRRRREGGGAEAGG